MLVQGSRLEARLRLRADNDRGNVSASVRGVAAIGLVKDDDQQSIFLEGWTRNKAVDVEAQPSVGNRKGRVVCIVDEIGKDKGKIRQRPVAYI